MIGATMTKEDRETDQEIDLETDQGIGHVISQGTGQDLEMINTSDENQEMMIIIVRHQNHISVQRSLHAKNVTAMKKIHYQPHLHLIYK